MSFSAILWAAVTAVCLLPAAAVPLTAQGKLAVSRRHGYTNDTGELDIRLRGAPNKVIVSCHVWHSLKTEKVPFKVTAGLGFEVGNQGTIRVG